MDIWIILDGEKKGPLHDFEIRRKIEEGELSGSTPAWHEGLGEWKPLEEIDIFTREFERAAAPATEPVVFQEERRTPPPLPVPVHYGRRFWARWLDITLYCSVWWFGMWLSRQNIESALLNPWIMLFRLIPWFIIEILLIHYFATTPGKWLFGLSVRNKDGSKLSLGDSMLRGLRVLFTGIGFGWDLLCVFCQALSFFTAKRLGAPLWDHAGGHQVTAKPLNPISLIAVVFLFAGACYLSFLIIAPQVLKISGNVTPPEFKAMFDEGLPWHLPKRP